MSPGVLTSSLWLRSSTVPPPTTEHRVPENSELQLTRQRWNQIQQELSGIARNVLYSLRLNRNDFSNLKSLLKIVYDVSGPKNETQEGIFTFCENNYCHDVNRPILWSNNVLRELAKLNNVIAPEIMPRLSPILTEIVTYSMEWPFKDADSSEQLSMIAKTMEKYGIVRRSLIPPITISNRTEITAKKLESSVHFQLTDAFSKIFEAAKGSEQDERLLEIMVDLSESEAVIHSSIVEFCEAFNCTDRAESYKLAYISFRRHIQTHTNLMSSWRYMVIIRDLSEQQNSLYYDTIREVLGKHGFHRKTRGSISFDDLESRINSVLNKTSKEQKPTDSPTDTDLLSNSSLLQLYLDKTDYPFIYMTKERVRYCQSRMKDIADQVVYTMETPPEVNRDDVANLMKFVFSYENREEAGEPVRMYCEKYSCDEGLSRRADTYYSWAEQPFHGRDVSEDRKRIEALAHKVIEMSVENEYLKAEEDGRMQIIRATVEQYGIVPYGYGTTPQPEIFTAAQMEFTSLQLEDKSRQTVVTLSLLVLFLFIG